MAVDPVCGMTVDPSKAAGRSDHKGTTYFFCSKGCLAKFAAAPETYLAGTAAVASPQSPVLTITGLKTKHVAGSTQHVGAPAQHVGASDQHDAKSTQRSEWTCPTRREAVSDRPGACP